MGVLIAVPEKFHEELGLRTTRLDLLERRAHGVLARLLGIKRAGRFGPTYFALRRRFGSPGWRTVYARETLEGQRANHDTMRRVGQENAS